MEWIYSMQKAINMIEENLLNDINPDEVAKNVYFSSYHFNRVFNMITGVSIREYIRNRRLSIAGDELYATKKRIVDIALKYGYETPEGFTKAFTRFHGVTPSLVRKSKVQLRSFNPISIEIKSIGDDILDYKIEVNNEFIGDKSNRLGDLHVMYNGTWDETLFNDLMCAIVAALNYIDKSFDTTFVAGASGAAFSAYWTFGTNNCSDFLLMGEKLIVKTFQNLGLYYTHYRKSMTDDWSNVARTKIVESIDNGFPAIVRFFDGYGVISGYDKNGKILYGSKMYYDESLGYFPRSNYNVIDNVIIINGIKTEISRKNLLRDCLEWAIHIATMPEFYNYENNSPCINGIACYDKIIELLRKDEFFCLKNNYGEHKIANMIYEYSHVKIEDYRDYSSDNGEGLVFFHHVYEELFCDFFQYNLNKRKFAPKFLRVLAKEFDFCADKLEKAALEYSKVYELYKEVYSGHEKTDKDVFCLKDVNYRNVLINILANIKEHEKIGISYMKSALQNISSVIPDKKCHASGDVD